MAGHLLWALNTGFQAWLFIGTTLVLSLSGEPGIIFKRGGSSIQLGLTARSLTFRCSSSNGVQGKGRQYLPLLLEVLVCCCVPALLMLLVDTAVPSVRAAHCPRNVPCSQFPVYGLCFVGVRWKIEKKHSSGWTCTDCFPLTLFCKQRRVTTIDVIDLDYIRYYHKSRDGLKCIGGCT